MQETPVLLTFSALVMFKIANHVLHLEGQAALAISRQSVCVMKAYKHSKAPEQSIPEHVVTTNGKGDIFLFWHPEKQIPFEYTKPMPAQQTFMEESPISGKFKPDMNSTYSKLGPTYKELCNMLYVTKHRFMPKPKLKRAKTDTPKDRNAL